MTDPMEQVLEWAALAIGAGATVRSVSPLREGGPFLVRFDQGSSIIETRLKVGPTGWRAELACEAAALELAEKRDLPAPRLIAADLDGTSGSVALLSTMLPGTNKIPLVATADRLRAVGAAAAAIHLIPLTPQTDLPARARHMPWVDFALERRWATRFQTARKSDKPAILEAMLLERPGWDPGETHKILVETSSTPLLDEADTRIRDLPVPRGDSVFVHGDLWQGNMLWLGDTCVGIIDWEAAGAGHYGIDLGSLRWDAAILFGLDAADDVLAGWEDASGRKAENVAYWDVVAALNTLAVLTGQGIHEAGREDLDETTLTNRRDDFLRAALERM
jgi:aminoglycoside phosphotransferase (APT) family kinase protein